MVVACLGGCAAQSPAGVAAGPAKAAPGDEITVMTFNLRFASNTAPNSWPQRRPVMRELLRTVSPDIIGTQEGLYPQLQDMAADLPEYHWLGLGRDGGSHGEFMAIFYKKDRFEVLEYDHFWLSDTPMLMASTTWGNTNRRMCTWIRLRDRSSGREFYCFNTHLDHLIQAAREKGAALIAQRIAALKQPLPVILTGDFNAVAKDNKAYDILIDAGMTDTWYSAAQRVGENVNSFHGYKPVEKKGEHIDWILTRGPVVAEAAQVVQFQKNGQYPSDHFPVLAKLRFQ
jgi:endonuclease/exonuclease/phosphatase family metal-dependent hydrolase